jgi:hypothetical protein
VRLGVLAAVLLLAGLLPWVTAGPLPARLVALPLCWPARWWRS